MDNKQEFFYCVTLCYRSICCCSESVCLSVTRGIVPKQLNVRWCKQHQTIAHGLQNSNGVTPNGHQT